MEMFMSRDLRSDVSNRYFATQEHSINRSIPKDIDSASALFLTRATRMCSCRRLLRAYYYERTIEIYRTKKRVDVYSIDDVRCLRVRQRDIRFVNK